MNYAKFLIKKSFPVIENLKKLKNVKAIALYGSVGKGYADKFSDVDIVCFCDKIPDKNQRKKFYKRISLYERTVGDIDTLKFNGITIGIYYREVGDIDAKVRQMFSEKLGWFERDISIILSDIKIIHDPEKIIKKWKQKIKRYPQWLKKENVNKLCLVQTGFEDILKGLRRKNFFLVDTGVQRCLDTLFHVLYALNGKYYSSPKWIFQDIKKFKVLPKNCINRIRKIMKLNNRDELDKKVKMINLLFLDTLQLCKELNFKITLRSIEESNLNVELIQKISCAKFL